MARGKTAQKEHTMDIIGSRRRNTRTGRIVTVKRRVQARETLSSPVVFELEGEDGRKSYAKETTVLNDYDGISDGLKAIDPVDDVTYVLADPGAEKPWQVDGSVGAEQKSYDLADRTVLILA